MEPKVQPSQKIVPMVAPMAIQGESTAMAVKMNPGIMLRPLIQMARQRVKLTKEIITTKATLK